LYFEKFIFLINSTDRDSNNNKEKKQLKSYAFNQIGEIYGREDENMNVACSYYQKSYDLLKNDALIALNLIIAFCRCDEVKKAINIYETFSPEDFTEYIKKLPIKDIMLLGKLDIIKR